MIVLHGGYLPALSSATFSGIYLWGEGAFVPHADPQRHPRSLETEALAAALEASGLAFGAGREKQLQITVPVRGGRPVPSVPALRDPEDYEVAGPFLLGTYHADALVPPPLGALEALIALARGEKSASSILIGDDLDFWAEVARWAFDLLLRRRVAPRFDEDPPRWSPVLADVHEKERFLRFAAAMPPASRTASAREEDRKARRGDRFPSGTALLGAFLNDAVDALARDLIREARHISPDGSEAPERSLVASLALEPGALAAPAPIELLARLREWSLPVLEPVAEGALRLGLRLAPPAGGSTTWQLQYHLESAEEPGLTLFAEEIWTEPGALSRLGRRFVNAQEALLAELGRAAPLSPAIARSLEESHPAGAEMSIEDAYRFLRVEAPLLQEAGISVLLPSEGRLSRVSVRMNASEAAWRPGSATRFGLSTLVDFDWKIAVGGTELTPEQFEELAQKKIPLVAIRGEWVLLDPESVSRTLQLLDRRPSGRTTLGELLRLAGGVESAAPGVEAISGAGFLGDLLDPSAREEAFSFLVPREFHGQLRPYQVRGAGWMRALLSRGLGVCLADDMGLGKTVQLLAILLAAREAGESIRPSLLVCPTSVAENWLRESARFAPSLEVAVHHGPDRATGEGFRELLAKTDLLVTTYSLAHRDRALLHDVEWEVVALDEAQNVKNPAAAQSRAVRRLTARRRAALTGTPVENHLAELKAIFDFTNPGLLGSDEGFRRDFAVPIERHRDPEAARRLRVLTAPFLLRRAKTDPGVVPDLPDKIETREWVGLTEEQATLYRAATTSLLSGIGQARGARRRAKVLLLLLRLKQICNHPAHFLADGSTLPGRSSKLERLLELLEETLAEGSPSLVFSQFAEMGRLLVAALKERFGTEVLFLHGGVPRKARAEMVRRFQEDDDPPPFFVLSLKAGGSGLNLTRASHVFHFDRWWNPAVEDQATDRAFRIGQTRNVQVHKFVCRGTLEERIDQMIEEKKRLAAAIVGTGESWLADMTDEELQALVQLSRDAVEEGR